MLAFRMSRSARVLRALPLVPLLVLLIAVVVARAAEPLPDRRAVRGAPATASPAGGAVMSSRETLVDLMLQLETLQNEVRQLRGQLEVQSHEIEQLKKRQRDVFTDFDRRVRGLERGGGGPLKSSSGAPVVDTSGDITPAAPPSSGNSTAPAATQASEQQEYDAAFNLLKQGFYDRAAKGFQGFIARHPGSRLADNAQYWVGEAHYVVRNFRLALEEFSKVVNDYPGSTKAPDALLKIGYSYYELGEWDKARNTLNQVTMQYPNTTVAKSAEIRLAKMRKEGH